MWSESKAIASEPPLPWEQYEYPGRAPLDDLRLHSRREGLFFLLAGLSLVAAVLLPAFGLEEVIDLSVMLPWDGREIPSRLPLGALALPAAIFGLQLVSELFGRKRAQWLLLVGLLLHSGVVGLRALVSSEETYWFEASALSAHYLLMQVACLGSYVALARMTRRRKLWLRSVFSSLLAQLMASAGMTILLYDAGVLALDPTLELYEALALIAVSGYAYAVVGALAAVPLLYLASSVLPVFLRLAPPRYPASEQDLGGIPLFSGGAATRLDSIPSP